MKKIWLGLLIAVMATSMVAFSASAAPASSSTPGPYEGIFYGQVQGDKGSRAPMALQLTHRDGVVQGKVYLGEGLYVDGGVCGGVNVPTGVQYASGKTLPSDLNRLVAGSTFKVSNINITVNLSSVLSSDGKVLNANAKIDLPWFCGKDPQLNGTLNKIR